MNSTVIETQNAIEERLRHDIEIWEQIDFGEKLLEEGSLVSDFKQFLFGQLAAIYIERNPSLCYKLLEHARKHALRCASREELLKILEGEKPIATLLRVLREHSDQGQVLRTGFPWSSVGNLEDFRKVADCAYLMSPEHMFSFGNFYRGWKRI